MCAAVIAAGLTQAVSVGPTADADTTAAVKHRTPRTNGPDLGSQDGFYDAGQQLTLVCHASGQRVSGFFSSNIPESRDDLWYRTSDGHYVAAVDIETHTLDPLGPDCNQAAPAGVSARANDAVAKANSAVGTDMFGPQGCGNFVAWSYGVSGIGAHTAKEFRDKLAAEGRIHMDQNFPRGALVFSENSLPGDLGHVDIAQGDGTFVSGGVLASYRGLAGAGHNVQVMNTFDPTPGARFLGWADAPW
ncbi:hypothetical protein PT015_18505 [Candidatus Mycobacterium wuenschmannii]|uniref:CHAP domain-containing protein n=1 Tax=Candidatus Mycobacterium wuenschmannii TaxID=3027808 RepID=A0ABY8VXH1_9MYCO|nr:hypothetical protein [Candidatus Mycobacterium wuenschmannii]WIM86857.1 hypothetical protein PT015_18505 [Candidatus Mycobacterium wuenschmannii]